MAHEQYRIPFPTFIYIEPTQRCNLNCKMCSHSVYASDFFLSKNLNISILEKLTPFLLTAEDIWLSGFGEPLLYKDLKHVIKFCREHNHKASIGFSSNGVLLNDEKSSMLIKSGLDEIQISIDGATTWGHGGGDEKYLKLVENNLHQLQMIKRKLKADNPKISFSFIAMKDNIHELLAVLELAKRVGSDLMIVQPLIPIREKMRSQNIFRHKDYVRGIIKQCLEKAEALGIELRFVSMNPEMDDMEMQCYMPFSVLYLGYNGDIAMCCNGLSTGQNLNDLPVEQIWNGDTYLKIREENHTGNYNEMCLHCPIRESTIENIEYFLDSDHELNTSAKK